MLGPPLFFFFFYYQSLYALVFWPPHSSLLSEHSHSFMLLNL
jgi:hypothetical protein